MADYPTVLLFDGPTRLGTLEVSPPTTVGHVLKVAGTSPLSVEWGAGGGGSSDHATLSNLTWTASAHTGTANRLAGFNGSGAAAYFQIGADVQAWSARLDGLAGTAYGSADLVPYTTGANTFSTMTVTAFARTILDDVDAAAVRTTIGAGTGSGDVTAASSIADNAIVRGDGGAKGVQTSLVDINDSGAIVPRTDSAQQAGNVSLTWAEMWSLQYSGKEQATVQAPSGGWTGRWAYWGKTGTPSEPYYTDDGGTDRRLIMRTDIGTTTAAGVFEAATPAEQSSSTVLTSDDHRLIYSYPPDKCGSRTAAGNAAGSGTGFLEGITYFATPARNYITGFGHIDSNTSSTSADRGWYLTPATNSHLTFAKLMGSRVSAKFAVPSDNLRAFVAFTEAGAPTLVPANAANTLEVIRLGVYNNVFTWSISDGTNETTGSLTATGHTAGTVYEYEIVWTSSTSVTFNIYNADRSTLLESTTRTTGIPASGSTTTCYIGVFIRTASTTPTVYYGLGRLRIP